MLSKVYIPYKAYYSTPFARWQGSLSSENAITLGAETSKRWFAEKKIDPKIFDYLVLGITIGQPKTFYGGPWSAALMGADHIPGLMVSQACSTATVGLYTAAMAVETGFCKNAYTPFHRPLLQWSPHHLAQSQRSWRTGLQRRLDDGTFCQRSLGRRCHDQYSRCRGC